MRATEWAGWIVIVAIAVFILAILVAGWYLGSQVVDGLASFRLVAVR